MSIDFERAETQNYGLALINSHWESDNNSNDACIIFYFGRIQFYEANEFTFIWFLF